MNSASLSLHWHNIEWQLQAISGSHSPLRMPLLPSELTRLMVGEAERFDLPAELPLLLSGPLVSDAGAPVRRARVPTLPDIRPSPPAPSEMHGAELSDH